MCGSMRGSAQHTHLEEFLVIVRGAGSFFISSSIFFISPSPWMAIFGSEFSSIIARACERAQL